MKLTDQLSVNANDREKTAAIFFDVEKAFDHVWHAKVCSANFYYSIPPSQLFKLIDSFLTA